MQEIKLKVFIIGRFDGGSLVHHGDALSLRNAAIVTFPDDENCCAMARHLSREISVAVTPIAPPSTRIRPFLPEEAAKHLGRILTDEGAKVMLQFVGDGEVILKSLEFPRATRRVSLRSLVDRTWADDCKPCGTLETE